jgi:6-phosphogluconolactonase
MSKYISSLFCLLFFTYTYAQKNYLLIGTYTTGKSEGIYVYEFDTANGKVKFVSTVKSSNPSFLTVVKDKFVYAVNSNDDGGISAYSFSNGQLSFINSKSSAGNNPCYIKSNREFVENPILLVGNYGSGNLVIYATDSTGMLKDSLQTIQHNGSSINEKRQSTAHVHGIFSPQKSARRKYFYVADLGMDKIVVYKLDPFTSLLDTKKAKQVQTTLGGGPRHMSFHNDLPYGYLLEELTGTVAVYKIKSNGSLKKKQTISAHPKEYKGIIGSADIHVSPNGKFLYASNRGDANSIAIFAIHPKNGKLTAVGHQSTLGSKPRNFNFSPDGQFLLVANQESGNVVVFKMDKNTGLLTDTGITFLVPSPVCLTWLKQ